MNLRTFLLLLLTSVFLVATIDALLTWSLE